MGISAVINTYNEEANIARCLKSVAGFVDEIVVVDMGSTDETEKIVREFTNNFWTHPYVGYVEPARNFAINKASGDWILLLDADEAISPLLGEKLVKLIQRSEYSFFRIPRKNIMFGKWIEHTGWWPDYQIRFFKKGSVIWNDEIHSIPVTHGKGLDLAPDEKNALIHYHYLTLEQYLVRLNRYTTQEATQLVKDAYTFYWSRVLTKPASEFLRRFFVWEGYKDGVHGLVLSLLQGISFLIVELKVWEKAQFETKHDPKFLPHVFMILQKIKHDTYYWYFEKSSRSNSAVVKFINKLRVKIGI